MEHDTVCIGTILLELARLLREDNPDAVQCLENLKKRPGVSMFQNEIRELDGYIKTLNLSVQNSPCRELPKQ